MIQRKTLLCLFYLSIPLALSSLLLFSFTNKRAGAAPAAADPPGEFTLFLPSASNQHNRPVADLDNSLSIEELQEMVDGGLIRQAELAAEIGSRQVSARAAAVNADLLFEQFEGATFPPPGWQLVDNLDNGQSFTRTDLINEFNRTVGAQGFGSGNAAAAHPFGNDTESDIELRSPPIDLSGQNGVLLSYASHFANCCESGWM